ncbi:hypothetical protein LTR17_023099 [Elasticomyces elasticus]|nr:hypothetical protein LTR17_023099 [Elasticomyces elasticus]
MASDLSSDVDSWSLMAEMLLIIKPFMPEPGHPLANEVEDATIRELMSTCMSLTITNLGREDEERQQAFAENSIALFDLKKWRYFPGLEEAAAKGRGHTGLEKGDRTSFQNVVFLALASSPAVMSRVKSSGVLRESHLEGYEVQARKLVTKILVALHEGRKEDSAKLLRQTRPGLERDPSFFLRACLGPIISRALQSALEFSRVEELTCGKCYETRESVDHKLILGVSVAGVGHQHLVYLLNDYLMRFKCLGPRLQEDCQNCGLHTQHCRVRRLSHSEDGNLFIFFDVFDETADMAEKDARVYVPPGAFPVAGPDCLYFAK